MLNLLSIFFSRQRRTNLCYRSLMVIDILAVSNLVQTKENKLLSDKPGTVYNKNKRTQRAGR